MWVFWRCMGVCDVLLSRARSQMCFFCTYAWSKKDRLLTFTLFLKTTHVSQAVKVLTLRLLWQRANCHAASDETHNWHIVKNALWPRCWYYKNRPSQMLSCTSKRFLQLLGWREWVRINVGWGKLVSEAAAYFSVWKKKHPYLQISLLMIGACVLG